MKRIFPIILCLVLSLSLVACTSTQQSTPTSSQSQSEQSQDTSAPDKSVQPTTESGGKQSDKNILVVYFSWSGNTGKMARTIAEQTNGEVFEIVPVDSYPEDYNECTEVALAERDENARPQIQNLPESLDKYDQIFIGYPIWWHTAPMIIGTFLENYDLNGVDIYPFSQSASMNEEQFEQSIEFVKTCAGKGTVHDGLFSNSSDSEAISAYISQITN